MTRARRSAPAARAGQRPHRPRPDCASAPRSRRGLPAASGATGATASTPPAAPQIARPVRQLQDKIARTDQLADRASRAVRLLPTCWAPTAPVTTCSVPEQRRDPGHRRHPRLVRAPDRTRRQAEARAAGQVEHHRPWPSSPNPIKPLTKQELALFGTAMGRIPQSTNFTPDFPRPVDLLQTMWQRKTARSSTAWSRSTRSRCPTCCGHRSRQDGRGAHAHPGQRGAAAAQQGVRRDPRPAAAERLLQGSGAGRLRRRCRAARGTRVPCWRTSRAPPRSAGSWSGPPTTRSSDSSPRPRSGAVSRPGRRTRRGSASTSTRCGPPSWSTTSTTRPRWSRPAAATTGSTCAVTVVDAVPGAEEARLPHDVRRPAVAAVQPRHRRRHGVLLRAGRRQHPLARGRRQEGAVQPQAPRGPRRARPVLRDQARAGACGSPSTWSPARGRAAPRSCGPRPGCGARASATSRSRPAAEAPACSCTHPIRVFQAY